MINLEHNKYPKGLTPLESNFSSSDASKNSFTPENPIRKVDDTIRVNIGSIEDPKNVYISITCTEEENKQFIDLFKEFKDIFAWSYADLRGFDPGVIQHAIRIKEDFHPVRQKQWLMSPALETTIQSELDKMLAAHIIFPVKYFEWVANLVPVRKKNGDIRLCVDFRALNKASIKDNFPLPNMELILQ